MAVIYLSSVDGSDSDDGSTWALAKATLAAALTAAGTGGTVYVDGAHAESAAGTKTLTSPGTAASPVAVLCVVRGADVSPPVSLATTATVTTTGNFGITFAGYAYCYGILFAAGVGSASTVTITFTSASSWGWRFESCELQCMSTSSTARIEVGAVGSGQDDSLLELINTPFKFNATAGSTQRVYANARIRWSSTPDAVKGNVQAVLFGVGASVTGSVANIIMSGVDLSALATGNSVMNGAAAGSHSLVMENCKLGSGVTILTGSIPSAGGTIATVYNCASGNINYNFFKQVYQGTVQEEVVIVRSGGASDGTTTVSRKMVSTANSNLNSALVSDWTTFWNESTGSPIAVSAAVITDNVTLTDAEAWIEVEYLGTSGFPLSLFANDRVASVLATPANQPLDTGSTWTTTGLTTPVQQTLSVNVTPQMKGLMRARVMLAKASTTMYYDPKLDVA